MCNLKLLIANIS